MVAPLSMQTRGLLERRGSSASLKLDLVTVNTSIETAPSPLRESTSSEDFNSIMKHTRMTRQQLRHMNIRKSTVDLFSEFAILENPTELCRAKINGCALKNRHQIWPINNTRVRIWNNNDSNDDHSVMSSSNNSDCSTDDNMISIKPDEDETRSYINANYITGPDSTRLFVAAEGPMPHTMNDFWAMIWQERSAAIVMITNLEESVPRYQAVERKCEKYWPDIEAHYGSLHVTITSCSTHEGIEIRDILLTHGNEEHCLRHFWFKKWLDHQVPLGHTTKLLKLIAAVEKCRKEQRVLHGRIAGPVVVHCSAGVGRTCTFIAIALGVDQLFKSYDGGCIDIASIVSKLRTQRFGAVQRPEQYMYIYSALQRMERLLSEQQRKCGSSIACSATKNSFPETLSFLDDAYDEESSDEETADNDEQNDNDSNKSSCHFLHSEL
ncbi:unnamed protein product [Anisakis simplex]|uniref:protein-tyrosine-phosphatase n=1 Tax=Anisakis simplex TaxID=6269 RepID=A0A0M3JTG4_ANISI|nr:unnamed protein product [Anisakis simplex]